MEPREVFLSALLCLIILTIGVGLVAGRAIAQNRYDFQLTGQGLNPDVSVITDFGYFREPGKPGTFQLREVELAFQAPVDPWSRADLFLTFPKGGTPEMEEGTLTLLALPMGLQAKLGKLKGDFGRENRLHLHVLPTADLPLMVTQYFGGEGLGGEGISLGALLANPWDIYSELRLEVMNGENTVSFSGRPEDMVTTLHFKNFFDVGEDGGLSLGLSYASGRRGANGEEGASFAGVDARYKWKPSVHQGLTLEGELLAANHAVQSTGYYGLLAYQFAKALQVGVRYEGAGTPTTTDYRHATTALLTYLPTECSFYRAQLKILQEPNGKTTRQAALQVNFNIGAHGPHEF